MNRGSKIKLILALIIGTLTIGLSFFCGYRTGDLIADQMQYIAVIDGDQFRAFEALIELDYNVKAINRQIDYTNGTGWLLVRSNDNGEVYVITAKIEKLDGRYEWVVVEEVK